VSWTFPWVSGDGFVSDAVWVLTHEVTNARQHDSPATLQSLPAGIFISLMSPSFTVSVVVVRFILRDTT